LRIKYLLIVALVASVIVAATLLLPNSRIAIAQLPYYYVIGGEIESIKVSKPGIAEILIGMATIASAIVVGVSILLKVRKQVT